MTVKNAPSLSMSVKFVVTVCNEQPVVCVVCKLYRCAVQSYGIFPVVVSVQDSSHWCM